METPGAVYVKLSGATPWRCVTLVLIRSLVLAGRLLEFSKVYFDEGIKIVQKGESVVPW